MFLTHICSSLLAMLFGVILLAWIIPTQTPEYPGYGMPASLLPQILSWIIIACGALNLIKTLITASGKGKPSNISLTSFLHCLGFLAVLGSAMPLMNLVGYWAGGAIIMIGFCMLCGERNFVRMAIVTSATVFIIWAALWKGLSVMLP